MTVNLLNPTSVYEVSHYCYSQENIQPCTIKNLTYYMVFLADYVGFYNVSMCGLCA